MGGRSVSAYNPHSLVETWWRLSHLLNQEPRDLLSLLLGLPGRRPSSPRMNSESILNDFQAKSSYGWIGALTDIIG